MSDRYYEAHLTVTPPSAGTLTYEKFSEFMNSLGWKTSKFEHDDVDGIAGQWFCSNRRLSDSEIIYVVKLAHARIDELGLEVSRWKVEWALWDSKLGHKLEHIQ